jgi:hypothetical protein
MSKPRSVTSIQNEWPDHPVGDFPMLMAKAEKPPESLLTIPGELHRAVMTLSAEDRRDRAKVNAAAAGGGSQPSTLTIRRRSICGFPCCPSKRKDPGDRDSQYHLYMGSSEQDQNTAQVRDRKIIHIDMDGAP